MRTEHATITGLWPRRATELASMNESESVGSHGQEARGEGYWSTTFNPSRNSGRGGRRPSTPHVCWHPHPAKAHERPPDCARAIHTAASDHHLWPARAKPSRSAAVNRPQMRGAPIVCLPKFTSGQKLPRESSLETQMKARACNGMS